MTHTICKINILVFLLFFFVPSNAQEKNDTLPFVCLMPEPIQFPGGFDSLKAYIRKNLKRPASDCCGEGTVYVKFKVDCQGNITKASVVKGIDSLANQEALRMINQMPKWRL
jgi:protein TonB